MPRSRSSSIESSSCSRMSRRETASVSSRIRSASVDFPWSIWAMIEKLRMRSWLMSIAFQTVSQSSQRPELTDLQRLAHEQIGSRPDDQRGQRRSQLPNEGTPELAVEQIPGAVRRRGQRGGRADHPADRVGDRAEAEAAEPSPHQQEEDSASRDVHERRREGYPPRTEAVERRVETGVEHEIAECDRRRDPVRLEAEEPAVEQEHHAVEEEARRECREGSGDHR